MGGAGGGSWNRTARSLVLAAASLLVSLFLLEAACRVYALRVFDRWQAVKDDPKHYFRPSDNPILVYELRSGVSLDIDGRRLWINAHGVRSAPDMPATDKRRLAVLGDSVVFGNGLSEEMTLPHMVQQQLDPGDERVQVLNFGVAGYGFPEIVENLERKNLIYDVDDVVFLLNSNDFARRDSIYEGADNGLYRMYRKPDFVSLWFVRKAIYRRMKQGQKTSVRWYQWLFDGNELWGYSHIAELKRYADEHGIALSVALLPAGRAYMDAGYALAEQQARIGAFLDELGIRFISPVEDFGRDPKLYFDNTDHLLPPGNRLMARLMADLVDGK